MNSPVDEFRNLRQHLRDAQLARHQIFACATSECRDAAIVRASKAEQKIFDTLSGMNRRGWLDEIETFLSARQEQRS